MSLNISWKEPTIQPIWPEISQRRSWPGPGKCHWIPRFTSSQNEIFRFDVLEIHGNNFELGIAIFGFLPTIWLSILDVPSRDVQPIAADNPWRGAFANLPRTGIRYLVKPEKLILPIAAVYCGLGGSTGVFAHMKRRADHTCEDVFDVYLHGDANREAFEFLGPPDHVRKQGTRELAWWFWEFRQLKGIAVKDPGEFVPILFDLTLEEQVKKELAESRAPFYG